MSYKIYDLKMRPKSLSDFWGACHYCMEPTFKNLCFRCLFSPYDGRYAVSIVVPVVALSYGTLTLERICFAVIITSCRGKIRIK